MRELVNVCFWRGRSRGLMVRSHSLTYHLQIEGRPSFLKKRSKKLLFSWIRVFEKAYIKEQKFFGSFFQKRTCLLFHAPSYRPVSPKRDAGYAELAAATG
jgi:hypothetical protein